MLVTDIEQSQKLSEAAEPSERGAAKRKFFLETRKIVEHYHGRLEKFTGDGSISSFDGSDRAADAIRCGRALVMLGREVIGMIQAASTYRVGVPRSGTRVGIASGVLEVIEADWREIDGPIIGVAVRLEANAAPVDTLCICGVTYVKALRSAPELLVGATSDTLTVEMVKGARDPMEVWRLP